MRTLIAAATFSAACAVGAAQTADQPVPVNSTVQQQQTAPIERAYPNHNAIPCPQVAQVAIAPGEDVAPATGQAQATPIPGVILRVGSQSSVREVSWDSYKLVLRVDRGVANVNVQDPAKDTLILIDLPGGQTQVMKNGLYTFNAQTNTASVLRGEALAFPAGAAENAKPIKVKEYSKVVYSGKDVRSRGFEPYEASVDLLPGPAAGYVRGDGSYAYRPYGYGFYPYYAYGFYPYPYGFYPYYAYGAPWGWGYPYYPYGYGFYPGIGIGFGFYGGFGYYGGFRGGYVGIHGGGFHGGHGR